MNAIISKVPLISEAPIEGKWYDLGTASREVKNLGLVSKNFSASDFNITEVSQYCAFAVKIIQGSEQAKYSFFNTTSIGYNSLMNFYVIFYPYIYAQNTSKIHYTVNHDSSSSFIVDCKIEKIGSTAVPDFTFTVQLLGMK